MRKILFSFLSVRLPAKGVLKEGGRGLNKYPEVLVLKIS
jgi:hypothetical protein